MALRRNYAGTYPKKKGLASRYYLKKAGAPGRGYRWRKRYQHPTTGKIVRGRWVKGKAAAGTRTRKTTKKAVTRTTASRYPWVIVDARGRQQGSASRYKKTAEKKLASLQKKHPGRKMKLKKISGAAARKTSAPRKRKRTRAARGYRVRSGVYMAANPYKSGVYVKEHWRAPKGKAGGPKTIMVSERYRNQWYPARYPAKGPGSTWISNWRAVQLSALNTPGFKPLSKAALKKIENDKWKSLTAKEYKDAIAQALAGNLSKYKPGHPKFAGFEKGVQAGAAAQAAQQGEWGASAGPWYSSLRDNPDMMRLLPTTEQLKMTGKNAAIGAVGFAGAIAMGKALSNVAMLQQYLGDYTSVVGNLLAGGALYAAATASGSGELEKMRPTLMLGAGVAALVNLAYQAVAGGHISADTASWVLPAAGSVAAAPTEAVAPTNGEAAMGQIDVYEAALDGVGAIEDELESELESLGGMGSFGAMEDEGIFDSMGAYLEVPLGAEVEEAAAGFGQYIQSPMGAEVEEAAAGFSNYETVPMGAEVEEAAAGLGAYLEVPLGADVEEAAAGFGAYESVPMGQYIESPMGAEVEEAAAGFGAYESVPMGADETEPEALMPGFRQAVQNMVRKRVASGQPMDAAFYQKLGAAAANLAQEKFEAKERASRGNRLEVAPRQPPVLRTSAPMYVMPVTDTQVAPGSAEQIPGHGEAPVGIFSRGIF